jgi:hypothetical protein
MLVLLVAIGKNIVSKISTSFYPPASLASPSAFMCPLEVPRSCQSEIFVDLYALSNLLFSDINDQHMTLFTHQISSNHCIGFSMEQITLRNVNNYLNTNIYSYLKTSGGQSSKGSSFFQHQC